MDKSSLLKQLRETTMAGMSDCKAALEETSYDFDKAVDLVKAKGLQNVSRSAGKVAAEGRIAVSFFNDNKIGTMVECNSQTDFVANSKEFIAFTETVVASLQSQNLASFNGDFSQVQDSGKISLEDLRKETIASLKENIVIRRWFQEEVSGDERTVISYIHSNGKIGVLLSLEGPSKEALNDTGFKEFAENTAMQIAAMAPLSVSKDTFPQDELDKQTSIFEMQLTEAKKPKEAWPKIMEGKFRKFFSESVLMEQESVIFPKKTIQNLADEISKKLCGEPGKVKILSFSRCLVGDGIKLEQVKLADEVNKLL